MSTPTVEGRRARSKRRLAKLGHGPGDTMRRRAPSQARAQATVDALLEATARVLVQAGYDHASTNRIAQAAGVSIGSLYQYFPSKESLVAALVDRHCDELATLCRESIVKYFCAPVAEAVEQTIKTMVAAHVEAGPLHLVLLEQVPRFGDLKRLAVLHEDLINLLAQYLLERAHEIRVTDYARAAFVIVEAVDGVIHAAFARDKSGLALEAILRETTALVTRYLLKDAP